MAKGMVTIREDGRHILLVDDDVRAFYMYEANERASFETRIEAGFLDLIAQGGGIPNKVSHTVEVPDVLVALGKEIAMKQERLWTDAGLAIHNEPGEPVADEPDQAEVSDDLLDLFRRVLIDRRGLN